MPSFARPFTTPARGSPFHALLGSQPQFVKAMTNDGGAGSQMQRIVKGAELQREQLQAIFNQYDADGSGAVSTCEMVSILQSLGVEKTQAEVEQLIKDSDPDGSVELT